MCQTWMDIGAMCDTAERATFLVYVKCPTYHRLGQCQFHSSTHAKSGVFATLF